MEINPFTVGKYNSQGKKDLIGRGAFAEVFKGINIETGEIVAIKVMDMSRVTQDKKLQEHLNSEVEIMKNLNHEHIVKLFDVYMHSSQIYMVFEFCAGGDFDKYLKKYKKLTEVRAQYFMRQLASGLKFLRQKKIMHRDLKPQNLLLNNLEEDCILKIADFGLARYIEPQSIAETHCGSPLYMAPEILKLQKYTSKADLWSVGAILYTAISGQPPFPAKNHIELIRFVEQKKKIEFSPDIIVSKECISLIESLLQQDPVNRISWEEYFVHPWINLRGSLSDSTSLKDVTFCQLSANSSTTLNLPQPNRFSFEEPKEFLIHKPSANPSVPIRTNFSHFKDSVVGSPPNPVQFPFNPTSANANIITRPHSKTTSYIDLQQFQQVQTGIPIPKTRPFKENQYSISLPTNLNSMIPPNNFKRTENFHPGASFGRESLDKDYVLVGFNSSENSESLLVSEINKKMKGITCIAELAEIKLETNFPSESASLYIKALQLIQDIIMFTKKSSLSETDQLKVLNKCEQQYREYLSKLKSIKFPNGSTSLIPTEKMIYDFALHMGREGGVHELLKNLEKSEQMYNNGLSLIEYLFSQATEESDKEILQNFIREFQKRIIEVHQQKY